LKRLIARVQLPFAEQRVESLLRSGARAADLVPAIEAVADLAEGCSDGRGPSLARHAGWLSLLGSMYREAGDPRAVGCLQKALRLARQAFGAMNPRVAVVLSNLGGVSRLLGRLDEAESYYLEALAIDQLAYGDAHGETLTDRTNLALLRRQRDDTARNDRAMARAELQTILQIELQRHGPDHLNVASDRLNWSQMLIDDGDWEGAEREVREALRVHRRLAPHMTIELANIMGSLAATISARNGDPDEVLRLHQQAFSIHERELGSEHPDLALDLGSLAIVQVRRANFDEALALMARASRHQDAYLWAGFRVGSERQRLAFADTVRPQFELHLSLLLAMPQRNASLARKALDLVLRRKGVSLDLLAAQRNAVLTNRYPVLTGKFRALAALRSQLTQCILAGPGRDGAERHAAQLAQWTREKEALERELAAQVPELATDRKLKDADTAAVAGHLPPGAALIEFVRLNVFDFHARRAEAPSLWTPPRYIAFVLAAGMPDRVEMVDLGAAEPIDQLINDYRAAILGSTSASPGRDLGALGGARLEGEETRLGLRLRKAIFDPLLAFFGNSRRLLIAPDGGLFRLPFEVLPNGNGTRLIDGWEISYLTVGRDLLRAEWQEYGGSTDPVVFSDPDFDLACASDTASTQNPPCRVSREFDRGLRFQRLPATAIEGGKIAEMIGAKRCSAKTPSNVA
jgi:tetratricopeptide (TPR) repeat protein